MTPTWYYQQLAMIDARLKESERQESANRSQRVPHSSVINERDFVKDSELHALGLSGIYDAPPSQKFEQTSSHLSGRLAPKPSAHQPAFEGDRSSKNDNKMPLRANAAIFDSAARHQSPIAVEKAKVPNKAFSTVVPFEEEKVNL